MEMARTHRPPLLSRGGAPLLHGRAGTSGFLLGTRCAPTPEQSYPVHHGQIRHTLRRRIAPTCARWSWHPLLPLRHHLLAHLPLVLRLPRLRWRARAAPARPHALAGLGTDVSVAGAWNLIPPCARASPRGAARTARESTGGTRLSVTESAAASTGTVGAPRWRPMRTHGTPTAAKRACAEKTCAARGLAGSALMRSRKRRSLIGSGARRGTAPEVDGEGPPSLPAARPPPSRAWLLPLPSIWNCDSANASRMWSLCRAFQHGYWSGIVLGLPCRSGWLWVRVWLPVAQPVSLGDAGRMSRCRFRLLFSSLPSGACHMGRSRTPLLPFPSSLPLSPAPCAVPMRHR